MRKIKKDSTSKHKDKRKQNGNSSNYKTDLGKPENSFVILSCCRRINKKLPWKLKNNKKERQEDLIYIKTTVSEGPTSTELSKFMLNL